MRKEKPNINHQFDIWHIGENIQKKIVAKAKNSKCQDLNFWIKSIINYFWFCCASWKGHSIELREQWLSFLNIFNIHSWNNSTIFKKRAHKNLTKRETLKKVGLPK